MNTLARMLGSRKVWTMVLTILSSILVAVVGPDYAEDLITGLLAIGGILTGGQVALDYKYGSPSDQAKVEIKSGS